MIIVIGGPTASGKTGLSIELAKKVGGEIVSADSMQIYKGMNIGTAKVTEQEKEGIPHHLIDIVSPNESFSVSLYEKMAKEVIEDIYSRKKVPIVVGGTGLYIDSLIYGYSHAEFDEELRKELTEEEEKHGAEYMWNKLCALDPEAGKSIHQNNVKRVLRAIEIIILTGKSVTQKEDKKAIPHLMYAIDMDRKLLYERINRRVEIMFENGLEKEVKSLLSEGVDFSMQSMQAIGYKEFFDYFSGSVSREMLIELIKQHSRNYAKKQLTWFKNEKSCVWIENMGKNKNIDIILNDYYKNSAKME